MLSIINMPEKKKKGKKNIPIPKSPKKVQDIKINKNSPLFPIIFKYSYTSNILDQLRDSFSL